MSKPRLHTRSKTPKGRAWAAKRAKFVSDPLNPVFTRKQIDGTTNYGADYHVIVTGITQGDEVNV